VRLLALAVLLAALSSAVACAPGSGAAAKKKGEKTKGRPSIIVLMTDDQDAASIRFMPKLERMVAGRGVTFDNSIVSNSFCCPSRITFLTGQYSKNHGVLSNQPPLGGYAKFAPTAKNALPVWLQKAGYRTAHVGHYPQGYNLSTVPPGWSNWYGAADNGAYGFTLNENGRLVHYGSTNSVVDPRTYSTDVESRKAVAFVRRTAPLKKPFFLSVAPFAPHAEFEDPGPNGCQCSGNNPRAAPRDEGTFASEPLPKPPSYDEADVSDKPLLTRSMTPIPPIGETAITNNYRARLEALQSVDDMVGKMVKTLRKRGELKNTVFIFTSDNGWLQGEHRWRAGKVLPYEPSIKVPLIISGPGLPKGQHRDQLVANVDLAPTILDFAGAKARRKEDGISLRPQLRSARTGFGRPILLEGYFNAGNEYGSQSQRIVFQGVRTDRYMYAKYETGEEELYDLQNDPYELQSRHNDPAYASTKASLSALLTKLQACAGKSCSRLRSP
jgi:N-acetylglucosamine-6-sulfatase